ncbi:MAG TPA: hypothetical protein K8V00_11485, partial [Ligilactobacillus acidipiscis]|nr:hypothetical protein [Ligilactobacillus acidipiscis]
YKIVLFFQLFHSLARFVIYNLILYLRQQAKYIKHYINLWKEFKIIKVKFYIFLANLKKHENALITGKTNRY